MNNHLLSNSLPRAVSALSAFTAATEGLTLPVEDGFVPHKEMLPLTPFLGNWECVSTVYPHDKEGEPVTGLFRGKLSPILRGAWYEWDYSQPPNALHPTGQECRYTFGWSPALERFVAIYFDDRGNHVVETTPSADWEDGHMRFTGSIVLLDEGLVEMVDDFTSEGPGHLHNRVTLAANGETWLHATLDFRHQNP